MLMVAPMGNKRLVLMVALMGSRGWCRWGAVASADGGIDGEQGPMLVATPMGRWWHRRWGAAKSHRGTASCSSADLPAPACQISDRPSLCSRSSSTSRTSSSHLYISPPPSRSRTSASRTPPLIEGDVQMRPPRLPRPLESHKG
ncbi:hypothetical protein GUJ93_ZPchr0011g28001 [Zizania palustris]|uniref:Uncharacterized protein n=1 Tax=Zizania palustris TaxID=103762 RepID=A0A8J5WL38_ZIZPA|nr:hypothetical protein GUJ93_ZPchr0011g28001 [Zizania palustris]